MASELVTNAIVHGSTADDEVTMRLDLADARHWGVRPLANNAGKVVFAVLDP